jgi:hypothetical protein
MFLCRCASLSRTEAPPNHFARLLASAHHQVGAEPVQALGLPDKTRVSMRLSFYMDVLPVVCECSCLNANSCSFFQGPPL